MTTACRWAFSSFGSRPLLLFASQVGFVGMTMGGQAYGVVLFLLAKQKSTAAGRHDQPGSYANTSAGGRKNRGSDTRRILPLLGGRRKKAPRVERNCAFKALFEHGTAQGVDPMERAGYVVGVCCAAAAAIEPCPTCGTGRAVIDVGFGEFVPGGEVCHALPDVAHGIAFVSYELMAGEKFAPGGDGEIFRSGAAAAQPLVYAGAVA